MDNMVLWPHRMAIALPMVSVVAVVATSEAIVSRGEVHLGGWLHPCRYYYSTCSCPLGGYFPNKLRKNPGVGVLSKTSYSIVVGR